MSIYTSVSAFTACSIPGKVIDVLLIAVTTQPDRTTLIRA